MKTKSDLIIARAQQLAEEHIKEHVHGLGDSQLEAISSAIITTSALITAQLLIEYDENKTKGNI